MDKLNRSLKRRVPIKMIDSRNGEVVNYFMGFRPAEKATGISRSTIFFHCKNKVKKPVGNYYFRYLEDL